MQIDSSMMDVWSCLCADRQFHDGLCGHVCVQIGSSMMDLCACLCEDRQYHDGFVCMFV